MTDELKHECGVAMVVLRRPPSSAGDYGGTKLSLLLEKQHNRGQDGAGAAILAENPEAGSAPYQIFKSASATPLADVLGMIGKRRWCARRGTRDEDPNVGSHDASPVSCLTTVSSEKIFLGHLRYATFGKNEVAFCHPFVHEASELEHTVLLAGNFNLTNAQELFDDYRRKGEFPTSRADGYLITELVAHELGKGERPARPLSLASAIARALKNADGAWTLCGATGDGWAFATRDPHGIRPGWYYIDENVVAVASERPAIQAAFDVPPEAVKELPPGEVLVVSPDGEVQLTELSPDIKAMPRPCVFERIYFSRANDADIHRERKALGAALLPSILSAADAPMDRIFFSYIPNSARIAFHGLLARLFDEHGKIRFGEVAVKDAKFRTFIADAAARREFYKHVYDVTYGLVKKDDTLVVLDDSIVRGNTMKNAILPMLDRLGPKRIVIASSAPSIRYPDCYGIDMSTLGELVAFRALVNLLDGERGMGNGERELRKALKSNVLNPLAPLYDRFTEEQHTAEIARLLTPPGLKAEVSVVYQTVEALRRCILPHSANSQIGTSGSSSLPQAAGRRTSGSSSLPLSLGDWYFTGDYPTPGGYKVLRKAIFNYLEKNSERSY